MAHVTTSEIKINISTLQLPILKQSFAGLDALLAKSDSRNSYVPPQPICPADPFSEVLTTTPADWTTTSGLSTLRRNELTQLRHIVPRLR